MAELTDGVLYADIWESVRSSRGGIGALVVVSALVAMNRPDQLRSHLTLSRQNGVTAEELIDDRPFGVLRGWPNAVTAIAVAKEVFRKN